MLVNKLSQDCSTFICSENRDKCNYATFSAAASSMDIIDPRSTKPTNPGIQNSDETSTDPFYVTGGVITAPRIHRRRLIASENTKTCPEDRNQNLSSAEVSSKFRVPQSINISAIIHDSRTSIHSNIAAIPNASRSEKSELTISNDQYSVKDAGAVSSSSSSKESNAGVMHKKVKTDKNNSAFLPCGVGTGLSRMLDDQGGIYQRHDTGPVSSNMGNKFADTKRLTKLRANSVFDREIKKSRNDAVKGDHSAMLTCMGNVETTGSSEESVGNSSIVTGVSKLKNGCVTSKTSYFPDAGLGEFFLCVAQVADDSSKRTKFRPSTFAASSNQDRPVSRDSDIAESIDSGKVGRKNNSGATCKDDCRENKSWGCEAGERHIISTVKLRAEMQYRSASCSSDVKKSRRNKTETNAVGDVSNSSASFSFFPKIKNGDNCKTPNNILDLPKLDRSLNKNGQFPDHDIGQSKKTRLLDLWIGDAPGWDIGVEDFPIHSLGNEFHSRIIKEPAGKAKTFHFSSSTHGASIELQRINDISSSVTITNTHGESQTKAETVRADESGRAVDFEYIHESESKDDNETGTFGRKEMPVLLSQKYRRLERLKQFRDEKKKLGSAGLSINKDLKFGGLGANKDVKAGGLIENNDMEAGGLSRNKEVKVGGLSETKELIAGGLGEKKELRSEGLSANKEVKSGGPTAKKAEQSSLAAVVSMSNIALKRKNDFILGGLYHLLQFINILITTIYDVAIAFNS